MAVDLRVIVVVDASLHVMVLQWGDRRKLRVVNQIERRNLIRLLWGMRVIADRQYDLAAEKKN